MASETRTAPRLPPLGEAWPPDDTEESVLGSILHQTTITNVRWGITEAAHVGLRPGQPRPWQAFSQTMLLGCARPDGSLYRVYPDVFVYPRAIESLLDPLRLDVDGPPALVIEVIKEATYEIDLDLVRGKGHSYARAGVREYLVLNPTGQLFPAGIRAWRLIDGAYHPWLPNADGRWYSETLAIAIGLEGIWATVYTCVGRRMLREGEIGAEGVCFREEMARRDAEIARRDAEIERLRRLLAERQGRQ